MFIQHIDYMATYTLKQYKQMKKAKAVKVTDKDLMIRNLIESVRVGLITYDVFLRLYLQIESVNE